MSKAVLISIRPEWCELIANGKKTIEVRKTKPKLETPFKCYIYCTFPKTTNDLLYIKTQNDSPFETTVGNAMVIGEFVCNEIENIFVPYPAYSNALDKRIIEESQASYFYLHKYAQDNTVYGWHISDLVIYDKPKKLSEFYRECGGIDDTGLCYECDKAVGDEFDCAVNYELHLTRPPQSWYYVEQLRE